ncbi:MAG: hypothetical protein K2Y71_00975 [Xanthobacteraceae bacterium]|nr:hypothetical protein [Xanthobacteraceae bacterium]
MSEPVLHKYFDFGDRALANLTLGSGERVLLTIVPNGFAVHMLHLFGMIPGRCLFGANELLAKQLLDVLRRDPKLLPPLPRAKKHQDDSADSVERPLSLFTRLALTARDAGDLVRLFERTRNIV